MSFFESLVNSIEETLIVVDRKQQILFLNRTGEELFEVHSGSVTGAKLSRFFHEDKTLIPLVEKTIKEVRPISGSDAPLKLKKNLRFDFTVSPLIEKDSVRGAVIILRQAYDMPGRVDELFESVMYLLSSVAHEIKNPLTGIRGGAQLLKDKTGNKYTDHLDVIIRETERLDSVVKNYLFVGRKPLLNRLNIHEVIEEVLNVLGPELKVGGILLQREYDPSLPQIMGDEGKLLQVFINIIKNARDAMPEGGTLGIKTKPSFEYMVRKEKRVKRHYAVAVIKDDGIGISDEDLHKVMMPFFTSKKGGSGLGLAISNKIIRDHDGLLKIESSPGKGTTVSLYLPFAGE